METETKNEKALASETDQASSGKMEESEANSESGLWTSVKNCFKDFCMDTSAHGKRFFRA